MNTDWHDLIQRYIAGHTSDAEAALLRESLKQDDGVARLYLRYMNMDVALESHASSHQAVTELLLNPVNSTGIPSFHWLRWRPLAAAAAGLVFGVVSASLVFGYSVPRVESHSLPLENAGFERNETSVPLETRNGYGAWGGEGSVVVAHEKVSPTEGKWMARFTTVEPADDGKIPLRASVSQAVDMRSWPDALRDGKAKVNCSASFNGETDPTGTRIVYRIDVRAYSGDVSLLQKAFPDRSGQEVAHSCWRTEADHEPSQWQRVSGSIILPPETDFLLVELKVFRPGRGDASSYAESAHYVDDVHLTLTTPAPSKTLGLTHSNP